MPLSSKSPPSEAVAFSRTAYLVLASLIQAVAFGVFLYSIPTMRGHAIERWPYLVSEFLTMVMVWFGHFAIARGLRWQLDLVDGLIVFLTGVGQCAPMLVLGRLPQDVLWWFVGYLALASFIFFALVNERLKTPPTVALGLMKKRAVLVIVHHYFVLMGLLACYYQFGLMLIGVLFMLEQIAMFTFLYIFDVTGRGQGPGSLAEVGGQEADDQESGVRS